MLAPGSPDDVVQVIDVRDFATWILAACEARTTGVFDAVGDRMAIGDLLAEVAAGVGSPSPLLTWVDAGFLEAARASSPGRATGRCRCGCRGPSTTG